MTCPTCGSEAVELVWAAMESWDSDSWRCVTGHTWASAALVPNADEGRERPCQYDAESHAHSGAACVYPPTTGRDRPVEVDLLGPSGLDLDGSCPSCGAPLDASRRGGYCEECG